VSQYTDYADRMKALDRSLYLGQLVWYTVAEELQVPHDAIKTALSNVGLDAHTPRVPSDADVFRRKCSAAQRKKVPTAIPGVFDNYLVRDPGNDASDTIARQIIREQVDGANRRLSYETVAEVVFDRSSSVVTYSVTDQALSNIDDVVAIGSGIVATYEAERGCLNGYAVRELIRRILVENHATNARYPAGGVYFLSIDHAAAVAGIEDMAATLAGVHVHSLPLPDDGKQRDMVKRAFEAESIDRANAMVTEIAKLKAEGKKIGPDRYATFVTELNELKKKMGEYAGVLETSLHSTASSLTILQKQVIGLLSNVDHGGK